MHKDTAGEGMNSRRAARLAGKVKKYIEREVLE